MRLLLLVLACHHLDITMQLQHALVFLHSFLMKQQILVPALLLTYSTIQFLQTLALALSHSNTTQLLINVIVQSHFSTTKQIELANVYPHFSLMRLIILVSVSNHLDITLSQTLAIA